jgi:hypothetical protein
MVNIGFWAERWSDSNPEHSARNLGVCEVVMYIARIELIFYGHVLASSSPAQ